MRKLWIGVPARSLSRSRSPGSPVRPTIYEVPKDLSGSRPRVRARQEARPAQLKFGYTVGDTENLVPRSSASTELPQKACRATKSQPTCTWEQANKRSRSTMRARSDRRQGQPIDNLAGANREWAATTAPRSCPARSS